MSNGMLMSGEMDPEQRLLALEQQVQEQRAEMAQLQELVKEVRAEFRTELGLLDREFTCLFRMFRVKLEADGLLDKAEDAINDFEACMHERIAMHARTEADHDEPTDPGGKRRSHAPAE